MKNAEGKRRRTLRLAPSKWLFGSTIGRRRVELGLTQEEAAARIGIERPTLGQLETGSKQTVSYTTAEKIAGAYGLDALSLWAIIKGAGDKGPAELRVAEPFSSLSTVRLDSSVESRRGEAPKSLARDVPIRATMYVPGEDSMHLGERVDSAPRPRGIEKALTVEAIRMLGNSMMPAIRDGSLIFYDAGRPYRNGDDVLLEIVRSPENLPIFLVRRLVNASESEVVAEHYETRDDGLISAVRTAYPRAHVRQIIHVLTVNELLGVN